MLLLYITVIECVLPHSPAVVTVFIVMKNFSSLNTLRNSEKHDVHSNSELPLD